MSPKVVDRERRKRELATTALGLFIENGFDATSISQIAEAAGVGKGTLYEYFDSKEDLILFSLQVWIEGVEQVSALHIDRSQSPSDQLRTFCIVVMEAFLADTRLVKSFVGMMQLFFTNERFAQANVIEAMSSGFRSEVVDILLQGVSQGVFKKEIAKDADKIAINLFAYLDGIGLHHMTAEVGDNLFFDVRKQVALHLDQVLASIETPSPAEASKHRAGDQENSGT